MELRNPVPRRRDHGWRGLLGASGAATTDPRRAAVLRRFDLGREEGLQHCAYGRAGRAADPDYPDGEPVSALYHHSQGDRWRALVSDLHLRGRYSALQDGTAARAVEDRVQPLSAIRRGIEIYGEVMLCAKIESGGQR